MANFIVTSLPEYVEQNRDLLIKNFALVGGGTRSRIGLQTGVKHKAPLNFLDLGVNFQNGANCGFDPTSTATLTQREIEVAPIAVQLEICPKTLLGKYAEYLVKVNATEDSCPFEEYIVTGLVNEIQKKVENLIWQGITFGSKFYPGLENLIQSSGTSSGDPVNASVYDAILAVYNALPEEAIERGAEIYVAPVVYRQFIQEMVKANFYHYNPGDGMGDEFFLPGTDVKVVKTQGLSNHTLDSYVVYGTFPQNLVYGTDLENGEEDIDIWWSKDDRVFKFDAEFTAGVQVASPELAVFLDLS